MAGEDVEAEDGFGGGGEGEEDEEGGDASSIKRSRARAQKSSIPCRTRKPSTLGDAAIYANQITTRRDDVGYLDIWRGKPVIRGLLAIHWAVCDAA